MDTTGRTGYQVKHVTIHSNDRVAPTISATILLSIATGTSGPK